MQIIKKQTAIFLIICMFFAVWCPLFSHTAIPAQAISTDYPVQLLRITNASDTADLTAAGTADRSALTLQPAAGTQAQNWRIAYVNTDSKGSFYKLYNMNNGRLLTPDYYSVTAGTNCVSFGAESTPEQHWYIVPVAQDTHGNDLYYKIVNYQDTNLALTGGSAGVTLKSYTGAENQKWMLQSSGLQGFGGYCKDMQNQPKASTIGGALGETVEVSTFDELKAACEDSTPRTIVITKNISKTGTYTKDSNGRYQFKEARIYLWPNKTIIGSYNAHSLYNVYFCTYEREDYGMGKNIIIRNIEISHDTELNNDNIWDFAYGENFWIDHCNFIGHDAVNTASTGQVDWDKFLTFKGHMDYITISDCQFGRHEYGLLMGHPADNAETVQEYNNFPCITLADNYFHDTLTRAPGLMRYGYFHSLNNYVVNFDLGYTMHTCAKIYTEACYYDGGTGKGSVVNDNATQITDLTGDLLTLATPQYTDVNSVAVNCYRDNNLDRIYSNPASWEPSSYYRYQAKTAEAAKTDTISYAGAKSSKEEMTYATFAEKGMPSASYSTAAEITMPSSTGEPKTGTVMDTSVKYLFKNVGSGLYLEVDGASAENGANVQQWGADGFAVQNTWKLIAAGDGYYYIRSYVGDGKTYFLDLEYGKQEDGTNIGIYQNTYSDAQLFKFVDNGDGSYTITTKVTEDQSCVAVESDSTASGANIVQWTCNGKDSQKWIAEIDTIKDGVELDESSCYMLKNVNSGLYMEVKDGAAQAGATVQQWGANGAAAHNVWHVKAINWGYYYVYSALGDGESFVLNLNNGNNAEPLTIETNNKLSTQYFKFVDNEDGTYTIVTRASKDLSCVEVADAATNGGAIVQQWEWNDNTCQKWVLEKVDYTLPSQVTTTTVTTTTTAKPTETTTLSTTTTAKPTETTTLSTTTTTKPAETTTVSTTSKLEEMPQYGDANLDGVIDLRDAIVINKYLAGSITLSETALKNGDCNADSNTDEEDANILIQFVIMAITELPYTN
ncbi:MAG: RICIN domain-containing protein [Ruminococcus sp.]